MAYLTVFGGSSGSVSKRRMLRVALPYPFMIAFLSVVVFVQVRRKCLTVSSPCSQYGHWGLSIAPILYRCAFRGAWPVRSCIRIDECSRGVSAVSFRKAFEGRDSSSIAVLL